MISGIGAAAKIGATVESTVREWWIRDLAQHPRFRATNTGGAENTISGNTDWKGKYLNYGHTPLPFPGDTFTFLGSVDGSNGVSGPAICERIQITCHGERGVPIETQVDFAGNGVLTPGAAVAADASAQTAITSIAKLLKLDEVEVPQLRMWRLVIGAYNRPGVHTGCATAGQTERTVGDIYAQWIYQTYVDDPSAAIQYPTKGSTPKLWFYVTNTTYWQLKWGRVEAIAPYGANRESAKNVGATIMGAIASEVGGVQGNIINPATTTKWGT